MITVRYFTFNLGFYIFLCESYFAAVTPECPSVVQ